MPPIFSYDGQCSLEHVYSFIRFSHSWLALLLPALLHRTIHKRYVMQTSDGFWQNARMWLMVQHRATRGWGVVLLVELLLTVYAITAGKQLTWSLGEAGISLRSYDQMQDQPSFVIIASPEQAETFIHDVLILHPALPRPTNPTADLLRQLDYQRMFAVFVFFGRTVPNAQWGVQALWRDGDHVRITARFHRPWPWMGSPTMIAEPYQMITVVKDGQWGQPIEFEFVVNRLSVLTLTHTIP
jgi:hypothetical protein